jgi:hypothetical protein
MAIDYYRKVEAFERKVISEALHEARGNQAQAARLLGLAPTTLSSQLRRLGIQARDFKGTSFSCRCSATFDETTRSPLLGGASDGGRVAPPDAGVGGG